jgi:type II secretory pathway pseudopilin PulG
MDGDMVSFETCRQKGMAYLALLLMVAILGAGIAATGVVWSQSVQRDNERELLRAGQELRLAIMQYYELTPGAIKRYPQTLEELLLDKRHLSLQRYLRRIPVDPMTRSRDWGVVRAPDGGIMGVFSLSNEKPIKSAGFSFPLEGFSGAQGYSGWLFVYRPEVLIKGRPENTR